MPASRRRALLQLAGVALAAVAVVQSLQHWSGGRSASAVAARAAPGDIVMVSSDTCPVCEQAKAWFAEHRVPYQECSIEREPACQAAYDAMNRPGTPTFLVRGQRLVGFDPRQLAAALQP